MAQGSVCSGCPTTTPNTPSPAAPRGSQHLPAAPRALQGMNSSGTARPEALLSAGTFSLSSSSSSTSTFGSLKSARMGTAGTEVCQAPGATLGMGLWWLLAGTGSSWTCWKLEEAGDGQTDRGVSPTRHLLAPPSRWHRVPLTCSARRSRRPRSGSSGTAGPIWGRGRSGSCGPTGKIHGQNSCKLGKKCMAKGWGQPRLPQKPGAGHIPPPPPGAGCAWMRPHFPIRLIISWLIAKQTEPRGWAGAEQLLLKPGGSPGGDQGRGGWGSPPGGAKGSSSSWCGAGGEGGAWPGPPALPSPAPQLLGETAGGCSGLSQASLCPPLRVPQPISPQSPSRSPLTQPYLHRGLGQPPRALNAPDAEPASISSGCL